MLLLDQWCDGVDVVLS